eukprot:CAMPEP_0202972490 /NCGR_PEP_ID=MMETSP1396-20130829/37061_1 /ASSEMBLY_ACC=CAM_ASM_000872 /TAXON_ID= /ORGANISM="Pseudokeronopsis sp., Strain Brazil" /LENGTH=37 /DNA_ID= /DNA_START= /DNA_END= /DNA_ORIENTATION=
MEGESPSRSNQLDASPDTSQELNNLVNPMGEDLRLSA